MALWQLMFGMGIGLVISVGLTLINMASQQKALPNSHREERRCNSTSNSRCRICGLSITTVIQYLRCGHAFHRVCLKNKGKTYECPCGE